MATNNSINVPTVATGKVLQGQGVGVTPAFSTATYPSTASTTGQLLRADGTNWVGTTATYPDTAGTSGKVITSDGTNFSSQVAPIILGVIQIGTSGSNPVDSTTYYMVPGSNFISSTSATTINHRFYVPYTCVMNLVYGQITVAGTLGSSENCTLFIRVNNSANTNISTTLQLTNAANPFSNTSLALSLTAGDFFSLGFTGPAWVTNPTSVGMSVTLST